MNEAACILVIAPTFRDQRELVRITSNSKVKLLYSSAINVNNSKNNILEWLDTTIERFSECNIQGVIATSDLGSFIAALISKQYGLDGTYPEDMYNILNKFISRNSQLKTIPACVPEFFEVDLFSSVPPLNFPFFMKPVRSVQSILASRIESNHEYVSAIKHARDNISRLTLNYEPLAVKYLNKDKTSLDKMIVESIIEGFQVTVEGYVQFGVVNTIGVIDSEFYSGTRSFKAFHYPSILPNDVQQRMTCIAKKYMASLNLNNSFFNIEMVYDENNNTIKIIEINPRMSSQFSDLIEKVDGLNSYTILLQLVYGEKVEHKSGLGVFNCASSYVLRCFTDHRVIKLPKEHEIKLVETQYPEIRVESYGIVGEKLSHQLQDVDSYKYGIIQLGGRDQDDLDRKLRHALKYLSYELEEINNEESLNG
jgi:hypothetical protein